MADSPDYRHWVAIAAGDLKVARLVTSQDIAQSGLYAPFHCQQCAEKSLKACLRFRNIDFPKVRDFQKLLRLCEQLSPAFESLSESTARLQRFAVQAPYSFHPSELALLLQALNYATST